MAKPLPKADPKGLAPAADQDLQNAQDKADAERVLPEAPPNNIGPDTVGVGQPDAQVINQGQSLPQSTVPVDKKFEKEQFYDPMDTERAIERKELADRGAKKTGI